MIFKLKRGDFLYYVHKMNRIVIITIYIDENLMEVKKEEILDLYHRNNIYRKHLDSKNIES